MTDRRDYGTFSRTAPRLLKPMVAPSGYQQLDGVAFGRQRDGWIETFFLRQSAYGSGDFSAEVGLSVPDMDDLWQEEPGSRSLGLIVWDTRGMSGLYPAADKSELIASLERVAIDLKSMDSWFAKFKGLTEIAAEYERTAQGPLAAINLGFLLILAGQASRAKAMLEYAQQEWDFIVSSEDPYLTRKRPGKDALKYHALNVHRLAVVEDALRGLA
jgi:hypothetical protein